MSTPMVKVVTFKCPTCGEQVMRPYHSIAASIRMQTNGNKVMCSKGHQFLGKYNILKG